MIESQWFCKMVEGHCLVQPNWNFRTLFPSHRIQTGILSRRDLLNIYNNEGKPMLKIVVLLQCPKLTTERKYTQLQFCQWFLLSVSVENLVNYSLKKIHQKVKRWKMGFFTFHLCILKGGNVKLGLSFSIFM